MNDETERKTTKSIRFNAKKHYLLLKKWNPVRENGILLDLFKMWRHKHNHDPPPKGERLRVSVFHAFIVNPNEKYYRLILTMAYSRLIFMAWADHPKPHSWIGFKILINFHFIKAIFEWIRNAECSFMMMKRNLKALHEELITSSQERNINFKEKVSEFRMKYLQLDDRLCYLVIKANQNNFF